MTLPSPHPWLDVAWADLGVTATSGPDAEARIRGYFAAVGHPEVASDATAWCAAFAGACLERAGLPSTRSLLARSYLDYGTPLSAAVPGAVAIFSRGSDPSLGHVAFVVGETIDGIIVLGGNQAHAVGVAVMPRVALLGLRWPQPSAGARGLSSIPDPVFDRALAHVLDMEGGYSDDPYDPGGPTNLGITLADLAGYRGVPDAPADRSDLTAALRALTPADVAPIYRALYWQPSRAGDLPAPLGLFHFDTAVNHGIASAARMLQRALSVAVDGAVGPFTLAAARSCDPPSVLATFADLRRARYRALPTFWRFGRGWLARVDATETAARALVTTTSPAPAQDQTMPADIAPASETTQQPPAAPASPISAASPKWWGKSLTIWGSIVTTLATVLPVVGPIVGIDVSADMIHQLGDGVARVVEAIGGVIGIGMTIYGRVRVTQPLMRRNFLVRF